MNADFAGTIARQCAYRLSSNSNRAIAENLGINKNTVARIKKIYKDVYWQERIDVDAVAKKHHVSHNIVIEVHRVARLYR